MPTKTSDVVLDFNNNKGTGEPCYKDSKSAKCWDDTVHGWKRSSKSETESHKLLIFMYTYYTSIVSGRWFYWKILQILIN